MTSINWSVSWACVNIVVSSLVVCGFIYFPFFQVLAVLGLHCYAGFSLVAALRLLITAASPVAGDEF